MVVFLYMNDETSEKEIKRTIPLTIASKTIKYLGINLIKEVKALYNGKYKTLLKETEEDKQMERHLTLMHQKK